MAGDCVRGIACEGVGASLDCVWWTWDRWAILVWYASGRGEVVVRLDVAGGRWGVFGAKSFSVACVRALAVAVELLGDSIRPRRHPAKLHPALTLLGIAPRLRSTTNCSSSRLFLYQREQCLEMLTHSSCCQELVRTATHTCIPRFCNAYVTCLVSKVDRVSKCGCYPNQFQVVESRVGISWFSSLAPVFPTELNSYYSCVFAPMPASRLRQISLGLHSLLVLKSLCFPPVSCSHSSHTLCHHSDTIDYVPGVSSAVLCDDFQSSKRRSTGHSC